MSDETTSDELKQRAQWKARAERVETPQDLAAFVEELRNAEHTYDSIVHACAAAVRAAVSVMNAGPQGSITGFQAGALGWECIKMFMSVEAPARIMDFNDMIYPQYADKFEKTIGPEAWEAVQRKAKETLEKDGGWMHPEVREHMEKVAGGMVPFGYTVAYRP